MSTDEVKFSVVIPCYNEHDSLMELFSQITSMQQRKDLEFILVDNGSTDHTSEIFEKIVSSNLIKLSLKENVGYGGGIKAGLKIARGEFLGWIHADLQYSLTEIVKYLHDIPANTKYIKGLRYGRSFLENFISFNMSIIESFMFKRILYDINAQPTLLHRSLYEIMIDLPNDFSIDLYSYVIAKKEDVEIYRINVNFLKRTYGQSSWNSGFKSILKMSTHTIQYSMKLRKIIDSN